ncbi:thiamine biosynthesis protein thiI [Klebsiella michiganensis]|nr:thiamine biosynthesis protein thiI [Klebsiella michiganensis]
MKFIIKLFPEITIKSQSVRLRFIKILTGKFVTFSKTMMRRLAVVRHWDHIEVRAKDENQRPAIRDALTRIPGIHHILEVEDVPYTSLHDIFRADAARCGVTRWKVKRSACALSVAVSMSLPQSKWSATSAAV